MSFANLKRGSEFDKLKKQMEASTQPNDAGGKDDPRFWTPSVDKAGNGMAIIRFLPSPAVDGDDGLPWVRFFKHGFQGTGGWLIDDCLTTISQPCPVCEYNTIKWNSGVESDKDIARKQKRKLTYISNVLVISDPSVPENNGKVFLFKFGKKIFDKLNEAMNPSEAFADEVPINPFDLWNGANFKIKMRQVEGYRNYDKSEFEKPSAVFDDDDKLEALWKSEYSLKEFIDPSKFNTYDQVKARLNLVLGVAGSNAGTAEDSLSKFKESASDKLPDSGGMDDDDADMNYFKSLSDDVPF